MFQWNFGPSFIRRGRVARPPKFNAQIGKRQGITDLVHNSYCCKPPYVMQLETQRRTGPNLPTYQNDKLFKLTKIWTNLKQFTKGTGFARWSHQLEFRAKYLQFLSKNVSKDSKHFFIIFWVLPWITRLRPQTVVLGMYVVYCWYVKIPSFTIGAYRPLMQLMLSIHCATTVQLFPDPDTRRSGLIINWILRWSLYKIH